MREATEPADGRGGNTLRPHSWGRRRASSQSPPGSGVGTGTQAPAAKPRVTDRFISLAFPALRCNQERSNLELSLCYPGRQGEGGSWGTRGKRGAEAVLGRLSQAETGEPSPGE